MRRRSIHTKGLEAVFRQQGGKTLVLPNVLTLPGLDSLAINQGHFPGFLRLDTFTWGGGAGSGGWDPLSHSD